MNVLLLVGLIVVLAGGYYALRSAQDFSDANEVVPGVPTNAPKAWAGAHTPEARMHRRLRDAVAALQSNSSLDDPAMSPVRSSIEEQALGVDERLIAAAALPKAQRDEPLRQLETAVSAIEEAVAGVVDLRGPSMGAIDQGLDDVKARLRHVEAARAELEGLSAGSSTFDAIREHIEQSPSDGSDDPDDGEAEPGNAPGV